MDEASLRAMRAEYFQGIPEHVWRSDEFNSSHHQYNEVFGRMIGEGRGVMEVATIMTQMRGRNVPSGMGNFMQDMQQMSGILNSNQSTADKKQQMEQMMEKMQKPNDRCACGSTKKYKKCCGSKKKRQTHNDGAGTSMLQGQSAEDIPTMVCKTKPTRDNKNMGWQINIVEKKKSKKKNKKSNKKNKVSNKIWISTTAPRVRSTEPTKHGVQLIIQNKVSGKQIKVSTTKPNTHTCSDPVLAIEYPNHELLGQPICFLTYGNYENANILSFDVPLGTMLSNQGKERPADFLNVPASFISFHQNGGNPSVRMSKNLQWNGGSSNYKCEILFDATQPTLYLTGKGAKRAYASEPQKYPEEHHGSKLQTGCIHSVRPTAFILHGDALTPENKNSISSMTKYISWGTSCQGDFVAIQTFRLQPDGRVWEDSSFDGMDNQNLFIRAFLTAADCHDTGCLPALFSLAKKAAFSTGRLVEFANATDRLLLTAVNSYYKDGEACSGFELHPFPETAFGYYAFHSGEAHEAASNLLHKVSEEKELDELRLAIASYKFGAYITSQSGAETSANYEMRILLWTALGLAIKRYASLKMVDGGDEHVAYFNMAERSYLWGLACIYSYADDAGRKQAYDSNRQSLSGNLGVVLDMRHQSAEKNRESVYGGMKDQRRKTKKNAFAKGHTKDFATGEVVKIRSQCAACGAKKSKDGTKLKRCSGCEMVWFCGAVW